jgi:hypothetical protein
MINLEIFRLEKNYMLEIIKNKINKVASNKANEALLMLVTYFLSPETYDITCFIYLETIQAQLYILKNILGEHEFVIFKNNIKNIIILLEEIKKEIPDS